MKEKPHDVGSHTRHDVVKVTKVDRTLVTLESGKSVRISELTKKGGPRIDVGDHIAIEMRMKDLKRFRQGVTVEATYLSTFHSERHKVEATDMARGRRRRRSSRT